MIMVENTMAAFEPEPDNLPPEWKRCPGCGRVMEIAWHRWGCADCVRKYPDPLLKAAVDPYDYALGLKDGTVIRFTKATLQGDYVLLDVADAQRAFPFGRPDGRHTLPYPCRRGVAVRLDCIAWAVDAPEGH